MPVPIMFAITMHVAVSREMRCGVEGADIDLKFEMYWWIEQSLARR